MSAMISISKIPAYQLTSRQRDFLAKGSYPEYRAVPAAGERCPRCHNRAPKPTRCDLCNPPGQGFLPGFEE